MPSNFAVLPEIIKWANEDLGAKSTMAGFVLLCTGACVRFRHLQRTRFQKLDEEFFFGEYLKG